MQGGARRNRRATWRRAVDWLRKKGLSKAAKKADRVAAEGLVGVAVKGTKGVARRGQFGNRLRRAQRPVPGSGQDDRAMWRWTPAPTSRRSRRPRPAASTIAEDIAETIAKIGENMTLRRAAELSVGKGVVGSYVHNAVSDGLGKMGVLVGLESAGNADELAALGRQVAMHVASANPQAVDPSGLDPATVQREKDVLADKFKAQGKPAAMIDKIVESGLKTYYKEVCCSISRSSSTTRRAWRRR